MWRGEHERVAGARFGPDGRWLATSTWNGKGIRVWELKTGKRVTDLPDTVNAEVTFSREGRWLVTGTDRGDCFWEVGSWRPERRTTAQAQRLGNVLKETGIPVTVFGARGTTHNRINADRGRPDDPATRALFGFLDTVLKK